MKRLVTLASSATLVAGACLTFGLGLASAPAGAATGNLTIVNAATYDYPGAPFTQTVCLDGDALGNLDVGQTIAATVTTGVDHTVSFSGGADAGCESPDESDTVNVADGQHVTTGLTWPAGGGPVIATWVDDTSCYGDTGRLTLRNAAYLPGSVDMYGVIDGVEDVLLTDVTVGGQMTVSLPAGTAISGAYVTSAGNPDDVIAVIGALTVPTNGDLQVYLTGGADGSYGAFSYVVDGSPCPTPTTTQPAAVAADTVTPAFTG